MSDIFISYKREDQPVARRLADALEKEGWSVWWDPKLRAGAHYDDVIEKALRESKCVIVIWSELSVSSRYVRDEATYALEHEKLVPVAVDNVPLPLRFRGVQTMSLVQWDGSKDSPQFRRLVTDISVILCQRVKRTGETPSASVAVNWDETRQAGRTRWTAISKMRLLWGLGGVALVFVITILVTWSLPQEEGDLERPSKAQIATTETLMPGTVFRDHLKIGKEGPEMVVITAGSFQMGSPENEQMGSPENEEEGPQHRVNLRKAFSLGKYEVTVGEFRRFVEASGYRTQAEGGSGCNFFTGKEWPVDKAKNWQNPGFSQTDQHPVVCVTWKDMKTYVNWLKSQTGKAYRLPTEAEWEYSTRGGMLTARHWGNVPEQACEYANVPDRMAKREFPSLPILDCEDGHVYTAPVGSYSPNRFRLNDTLGNVWEWVEDCWHINYRGSPSDGRAWREENGGKCDQRVIRGGSWRARPEHLRVSNRFWNFTADRNTNLGFRLARDLQ